MDRPPMPTLPAGVVAGYGVLEGVDNPRARLLQAAWRGAPRTCKNGVVYDWNVDSSAATLRACTAMAGTPYFAAG